MSTIHLSYLLTTFNKIDYLKVTLPLLIAARQKDEEIVVVDGGSSDGTSDYLKELHLAGKIQKLVSEPDHGEAEGLNKAILQANGTLLKIITDDDLFDYALIQSCKIFMLEKPHLDVLGADGYSCKIGEYARFEKTSFIEGYKNWQRNGQAFLFCGLSLMIRRSSIAYLGLFSTAHKIIDMEYSLRISSLKSRIAFCDLPAFINMVNPASNSVRFYEQIRYEYKQLKKIYPGAMISFKIKNPILKMKERIHNLLPSLPSKAEVNSAEILQHYQHLILRGSDLFIRNSSSSPEFLIPNT